MNLFSLVINILIIAWALGFVGQSLIDVYFYYVQNRKKYLTDDREELDDDEEIVH